MRLVVGIDAGGTSSRCVVADERGARLRSATGPGGNPNSSADAGRALTETLARALAGAGPAVEVVVLSVAGGAGAGAARAGQALAAAAAAAGVRPAARLIVTSDIEAAYAAGSDAPDGCVLIAGTGAVAARIEGFAVARRCDGYGYLLGDAGSAVWIGLAACRAVLAELDGRGPRTSLREALLAAARRNEAVLAGGRLDDVQAVIATAYAHEAARLGRFAPLVEAAAEQGDAVAAGILACAVDELVATCRAVLPAGTPELVVTGAVATGSGLLGRSVRGALGERLRVTVRPVPDGTAGAVAIARRALPGGGPAAPAG